MAEYFLISYHHINRQFLQSFWDCAWDTSLTMNKNTYLHDYKNKKFLIKKSYLVKDDDILVSDYLFQDGVLWILANSKDTT